MNRSPSYVRKIDDDPRADRTRRVLGAALVALMRDHKFQAITVQQILDRAQVGRATFYTHFRNKHDLMISDAERYFELLERQFVARAEGSMRLAPVEELFSHVAEQHHLRLAIEQSSLREPVFDLLTGHLAQIIARRLPLSRAPAPGKGMPTLATARVLAAALVELMRWWLPRTGEADARKMDWYFHNIAWGGLASTTPGQPDRPRHMTSARAARHMSLIQQMQLPQAIRVFVDGARVDPIRIGRSAATVVRLMTPSGTLVLKTCSAVDEDGLEAEAERLRWLAGRQPVPEVVSFVKEADREYLLVTSVPGVNGVEAGRVHPGRIVTGLARALKLLHAQPAEDCPFSRTVAAQIERARRRVAAGVVDPSDFDEERIGRTAHDLLTEVEAWRPADGALTLTHGDPCLANIMFNEGRVAGFVDCGRVGLADPSQDLALAARSIATNLGQEHVGAFFAQYGVPQPDERKLAFYRLLDEFF